MTAAVNLTQRLYIDEGGRVFPITNLFDRNGDECCPDVAVTAVAGEGGCWFSLALSDFEDAATQ